MLLKIREVHNKSWYTSQTYTSIESLFISVRFHGNSIRLCKNCGVYLVDRMIYIDIPYSPCQSSIAPFFWADHLNLPNQWKQFKGFQLQNHRQCWILTATYCFNIYAVIVKSDSVIYASRNPFNIPFYLQITSFVVMISSKYNVSSLKHFQHRTFGF